MGAVSGPGRHVTIYYDGDCPFCSDYVRYLRLEQSTGAPKLVNLRDAPEARQRLEREGFDLDRGMVAEIGGVRYEGAEALQALALLTTKSGLFNRATAALFSSKRIARWLYPVLREGRNTALEILGRTPFRRDDSGWKALFTVFSLVLGFFAAFHFLIYAFRYTAFDVYLSAWLVLAFGLLLLFRPGAKRLFVLLLAAMAVNGWLYSPIQSNHTILSNFLLLAFLGSGVWHLSRRSGWNDFFRDAVPVGRVLLLVMYFYGVFHKINEGFLDPEVSCAVTLWRAMPWPINLLDFPLMHYATIYGTFIVEGAIVAMLLVPRWRQWGIVLGIAFHALLAMSGFAMYPAFSTLTVALHVLYLSPARAGRIVSGANVQRLISMLRSPATYVLVPVALLVAAFFVILRDFNTVGLIWLLLAAPIFAALLFPGPAVLPTAGSATTPPGRLLWSRLSWLNVVGLAFFLNCAMPYFGLKTAQTTNMFANLRLEGGINNHLVMRFAPAPFRYLDDLVELRSASGDVYLESTAATDYRLVYYHLLDRLDRSPEATVTYVRDGIVYEDQSASTLAEDISATLHPAWFRKWFHFQRVPEAYPPPCF